MKIELKRFTSNERLSQETVAYAADIYVDGKKAGTTRNAGHGGPDEIWFTDRELEQKVYAFIKAMPPLPADPEKGITKPMAMDVDLYFGLLSEKLHTEKQDAQRARRAKKFAAKAQTRGFKAYVAKFGSKGFYEEVLFEAKTLERAQEAVTTMEKEQKKGCFFMDEVTP